MPDQASLVDAHDFVRRLVEMKAEAGRIGLFRTMQKLDAATQEVGYELAEHIEKAGTVGQE